MYWRWGRASITRVITTSMGANFASGFCDFSRAVALVPRSTATSTTTTAVVVAFRPTTHLHYEPYCRGGVLAKATPRLASSADVRRSKVPVIGALYPTTASSRGFATKRPRATGNSQSAAGKPEVRHAIDSLRVSLSRRQTTAGAAGRNPVNY